MNFTVVFYQLFLGKFVIAFCKGICFNVKVNVKMAVLKLIKVQLNENTSVSVV